MIELRPRSVAELRLAYLAVFVGIELLEEDLFQVWHLRLLCQNRGAESDKCDDDFFTDGSLPG